MIGFIRKCRELYANDFPMWENKLLSSDFIWDENDTPIKVDDYVGIRNAVFYLYPQSLYIGKVFNIRKNKVWISFLHINTPPIWRSKKKFKRVVIKYRFALDIELTPLQIVQYYKDCSFEIIPFEEN